MLLPAYLEQGDGDTAVFMLHGVGGGKEAWARNQPMLAAAAYRAVAWDMPGYGASPSISPCTNALLADALKGLIMHIGAKRNVLLGHSMGGMVAQEVAARAPQVAAGLVLACTSASFGRADGAWQAKFVAERLAPLDAGLGMAGMAELLVPGIVSPQAPAAALKIARDIMAQVPESTYRVALPAIAAFDRREALVAIHVPTLLLAAADDRTAPPEIMQRMASRVPGSEYLCLPGAGHIANVEAPEAFNAAVVGFLQRHFSDD